MSKPTVLLIGDLTHTNQEWSDLGQKFTLLEYRQGERTEFLNQLKNGTYDGVVGLYRSNQSAAQTGPFDKELVALLPPSVKYICHNGAGYDNIDVQACNERKIAVSSTPIAVDDATADVGVFLMLGALRQAHIPLTALREGQWRGKTPIGHDPKGKVLGILGMGGIGRAMAHRARAFGMKIAYHNRTRLSADLEGDATYLSFTELLAQSDVFSLNLSLSAKTRHIISARELGMMKAGVVIINTARGALIDEADLVAALESGQVASVGLDVFEDEPAIHPGLVQNERAFLLPHIGTNTYETQREMELLVLRNLQSGVETGRLLTIIPEQKGLEWVKKEAKINGHL